MEIRIEISDYNALKRMSWCNEDNFDKIERFNLEDEYFDYVEYMMDGLPTDTEVNDFMRFNEGLEDWLAEHLSLEDVEDLDDLDELDIEEL